MASVASIVCEVGDCQQHQQLRSAVLAFLPNPLHDSDTHALRSSSF